jgi:hypothetical protein
MDATSAAHDFVFFIYSKLREGADAGSSKRRPGWMGRTWGMPISESSEAGRGRQTETIGVDAPDQRAKIG